LICVANQKGGVAKTTTSVNLACGLALRGHKVLVVDIDPQSNATTGLGIDHRSAELSTYDLLTGDAGIGQVVQPTAVKNLDCAPSSLDLAGAEIELAAVMDRERRLAEALASARDRYDVIFIDCPPSLGLLTVNALTAADDLIVPVQCEYYALEGLGQLLETAERVRSVLNPHLRIAGFLMTMYDARTKLSSQVMNEVKSHFGDLVYETLIPRSVRLSEAPSFGEPALTLDPSSRGAISYRLLAVEVEERYGLPVHEPPPPPPVADVRDEPQVSEIPVQEERTERDGEEVGVAAGAPGPGGRGFGAFTVEPEGLDTAWPIESWRVL